MTTISKQYLGVFHLLFLLFSINLASAQILAREQFELTTGTISGRGSGIGWYEDFPNWVTQNNSDSYTVTATDPMSFTGVETVGNHLTGGLFETTGRYIAGPGFGTYLNGSGEIASGTLYFTFLIRKELDNDFAMEVILTDSPENVFEVSGGAEHIKIGYFGTDSNDEAVRYWSLALENETQLALTDTPIMIDQTYRMVVEIDFGTTTTTVSLWVDAPVGDPLPMTPDASLSTSGDLSFWNLVLFFDGDVAGQGSFDEFVFSDDVSVVLPVEMRDFYAETHASHAKLNWITDSELNNDRFVIEKSIDGIVWRAIGSVTGNGTSKETHYYSFNDYDIIDPRNYYRLKQVDFNGAYDYSETILVSLDLAPSVSMFQRANGILIQSPTPMQRIQLVDMSGRIRQDLDVDTNNFLIEGVRKREVMLLRIYTRGRILSEKFIF